MKHLKRILAVFIVFLTAFLLVPKGKAANSNEPYGDESEVIPYNDVNTFESYTYTTKYLDKINYKPVDKYHKDPVEDIVTNVIPIDLFRQRGTHMHIGLKYGFFVQTQRVDPDCYKFENAAYDYNYYDKINVSEVFLFKIERTLDMEKMTFNTRIEPTFSGAFSYCFHNNSKDYTIFLDDVAINAENLYINSAHNNLSFMNSNYMNYGVLDRTQFVGYIKDKDLLWNEVFTDAYYVCADLLGAVVNYVTNSQLGASLTEAVKLIVDIFDYYGWDIDAAIDGVKDFIDGDFDDEFLDIIINRVLNMFSGGIAGSMDKQSSKYLIKYIVEVIRFALKYDKKIRLSNIGDYIEYISSCFKLAKTQYNLGYSIFKEAFSFDENFSVKKAVRSLKKSCGLFIQAGKDAINCLIDLIHLKNNDPIYARKRLNNNGFSDSSSDIYQLRYPTNIDDETSNYVVISNAFAKTNGYSKKINETITSELTITFNDGKSFANWLCGDSRVKDYSIGESKYTISSTFKTKVSNETKIDNHINYINSPTINDESVSNDIVFYTGLDNNFKAYFSANESGNYRFDIYAGYKKVFNYYITNTYGNRVTDKLAKGNTYIIVIDTLTIDGSVSNISDERLREYIDLCSPGNKAVSIDISFDPVLDLSQKYDCGSSTAEYIVTLDCSYYTKIHSTLTIINAYYYQTYHYSSYSYTRPISATSISQVNNYTWRIKFGRSDIFTIDYTCNTNCKLLITKA